MFHTHPEGKIFCAEVCVRDATNANAVFIYNKKENIAFDFLFDPNILETSNFY